MIAALALLAAWEPAMDQWYPWQPQNDHKGGFIGMHDWAAGPAGKHGFTRFSGDDLVYEDGTKAVLWGINHGNTNCAPPKDVALARAERLGKYGINAVRLHKFTYAGDDGGIGDREDSTKLTPEGWDRLDFYTAELKKRGIAVTWSHIYGHKPRPGDRDRLLAYDEVGKLDGHLGRSTVGMLHFAKDLGDLSIDLTVHMLEHVNPYTGLRYADEPALAYIELQNEDNIFFPTTQMAVLKAPTYKKLFCGLFTDWLLAKYGNESALMTAWGPLALNAYPEFQTGESVAARNLFPGLHMWWFSNDGLANQTARGLRRRVLDTAEFLYETQSAFYRRFVAAIRATGYRGAIVGSCWQAEDGVGHYWNLLSDAEVGLIDRHNYGGGMNPPLRNGERFDNSTELARPGSGIFSTGLQQVAGRPFALSEWVKLPPNDWVAETPAILAAYGMGLQGWDASFQFANDYDEFVQTTYIRDGWGVWVVDTPNNLGMYPALARMVRRGDVPEGKPLPPRRVAKHDLREGKLGFEDRVTQERDVKVFDGSTPQAALALGKVQVEFVDQPTPTEPVDLSSGSKGRWLLANNDALRWWTDGVEGFFTVDTPGTQAVVGFSQGLTQRLADVTIQTPNHFALVFVSAPGPTDRIPTCDRLLVTAMARQRNTGQVMDGDLLVERGKAPILLEPVKATLRFHRKRDGTLHVLDHDGRRTGVSRPVSQGEVALDGVADRTPYYELEWR